MTEFIDTLYILQLKQIIVYYFLWLISRVSGNAMVRRRIKSFMLNFLRSPWESELNWSFSSPSLSYKASSMISYLTIITSANHSIVEWKIFPESCVLQWWQHVLLIFLILHLNDEVKGSKKIINSLVYIMLKLIRRSQDSW